jgi:hypothetical protein
MQACNVQGNYKYKYQYTPEPLLRICALASNTSTKYQYQKEASEKRKIRALVSKSLPGRESNDYGVKIKITLIALGSSNMEGEAGICVLGTSRFTSHRATEL